MAQAVMAVEFYRVLLSPDVRCLQTGMQKVPAVSETQGGFKPASSFAVKANNDNKVAYQSDKNTNSWISSPIKDDGLVKSLKMVQPMFENP